MSRSPLTQLMGLSRSVGNGPEAELCEAVLESRLPTDKRLPRIIFREPRLPTGYPDVVAVYARARSINYACSRWYLMVDHVRVMHFLYWNRGANLAELADLLVQSLHQISEIVEHLQEARMVIRRGYHVAPRALEDLFIARRIVAIELKVSDWQKAIVQAAANTWFASHSYILIRPHRSIKKITRQAKNFGIGVLIFKEQKVHTVLEAEERNLPASYGSWIVNEWTMHRLCEGDAR